VFLTGRPLSICYASCMGAQPGDILSGHILGQDNEWHRLAGEEWSRMAAPAETDPVPVPRMNRVPRLSVLTPFQAYSIRYMRRWRYTVLAVGLLCGVAVSLHMVMGAQGRQQH
jgi:hypothetical protein